MVGFCQTAKACGRICLVLHINEVSGVLRDHYCRGGENGIVYSPCILCKQIVKKKHTTHDSATFRKPFF